MATPGHEAFGAHFEREADGAAAHVISKLHPEVSQPGILGDLTRQVSRGHRLVGGSHEAVDPARNIEPQSAGVPLPAGLRSQMGEALGADLSGVSIHAGEEGHSVSTTRDALAVTSGRHVYFAQGAYRPHDPAGRALLAHELAHTVQQGAVPTTAARSDGAANLSVGSARMAGPQRSGIGSRLGGVATGVGGAAATHQVLTHLEQQKLAKMKPEEHDEHEEQQVESEQPSSDPTPLVLRQRSYPAFYNHPSNPMRHVFLTVHNPETDEEHKVSERGDGREDWQDVSTVTSQQPITQQQASRLQEAHQRYSSSYHPSLYGPMHNDCHTWSRMSQEYAGIETPLESPRFVFGDKDKDKGKKNDEE